ncbi:hypothetical protein ACFQ4O_02715 [Methylopila musalis]|uniref:Uncharacterized protein n=1 Tax=Methylopila musalis TaxID=1134781 RepID=A0ABW3Z4P6_9HYPH
MSALISYGGGTDAAEPFQRKQIVISLIEETAADVSTLVGTRMNRVGERTIFRVPAMSIETGRNTGRDRRGSIMV